MYNKFRVEGDNENNLVHVEFKMHQGHPDRYFQYKFLDRWS